MLSSDDVSINYTDGFIIIGLDGDFREKLLKLFRVGESKIWFVNI